MQVATRLWLLVRILVCVIVAQRKHEVERIRQQFPNKIPVCTFILMFTETAAAVMIQLVSV